MRNSYDSLNGYQSVPEAEAGADDLLAGLALLEPLRAVPSRTAEREAAGLQQILAQTSRLPPVSGRSARRLTGWWKDWRRALWQGGTKMSKLITIGLIASLLLASTGAAAYAAQDSLPAGPLYALKLAGEDVRLGLAPGPEAKLTLLLGYVERRAEEFALMASRGQPIAERAVERLEAQLEACLRLVSQHGDAQLAGALERTRDRLATQTRLMDNARVHAPSDAALARGLLAMQQTQAQVENGLQEPQRFREQFGSGHGALVSPPVVTPGQGPGPQNNQGPGSQNDQTPGPQNNQGPGPQNNQGPGPQSGQGLNPTQCAIGGPGIGPDDSTRHLQPTDAGPALSPGRDNDAAPGGPGPGPAFQPEPANTATPGCPRDGSQLPSGQRSQLIRQGPTE